MLDTGVLIHLARNDSTGQVIESQYGLTKRKERPLLSTIVEADDPRIGSLLGLGCEEDESPTRLAPRTRTR